MSPSIKWLCCLLESQTANLTDSVFPSELTFCFRMQHCGANCQSQAMLDGRGEYSVLQASGWIRKQSKRAQP